MATSVNCLPHTVHGSLNNGYNVGQITNRNTKLKANNNDIKIIDIEI